MSAISTTERAARARAARGYAGITQRDMAKALNVSVETLSRMENGRRAISLEEMEKIGMLSKVPPAFMEFGFETGATTKVPHHGAVDVEERLAALEAIVPAVTEQLAHLEESLAPKDAAAPATLEEALERLGHATDVIQRLEKRLGENIGRTDTRYRAARGQSQGPPRAAA